jgi:hypothetical protein
MVDSFQTNLNYGNAWISLNLCKVKRYIEMNEALSLIEELSSSYGITVPENFTVVTLDTVSHTVTGLNFKSDKFIASEYVEPCYSEKIHFLTPKSILPGGGIDFENLGSIHLSEVLKKTGERQLEDLLIEPNDILMSKILTRKNANLAFVSDDLPGKVTFADSIIRIRVDKSLADPNDVFKFLSSDRGWTMLQQFASSLAGMPRISASGLAKIPVFLQNGKAEANFGKLSNVADIIQQIENRILPRLREIESSKEQAKYYAKSDFNDSDLHKVGQDLKKLASNIVVPSLAEKVLGKYPTPIALAYQRFQNSKFNVYEQVRRLVDLYESATYFVYNLVFSDLLRRLDPQQFYIAEKRYRTEAYQNDSLGYRIGLIKEVIKIAGSNQGSDLFIPELVNTSFIEHADKLKELRNELAHTATAPEGRQRKYLEDKEPVVEKLLSDLDFLADCRLVRIPFFRHEGGELVYRMEVYQGVAPFPDKQAIESDSQSKDLQSADHSHLVLLNKEKVLDLHPLYQLIHNEQTQYESHICFLKMYKSGELRGESTQNCDKILLNGCDDFKKMTSRLLNKPPEF